MLIYHITETATWQKATETGSYVPSGFENDGFIHCSLENQVLDVAKRFYKNVSDLSLLQIDTSRLNVPLIFENLEGNAELFPHIYGMMPVNAVVGSLPLNKDEAGGYLFPEFPWTS